ncbi:MAG: hypothetical protein ACK46O_11665 [Flavobacteriia bacterium]
MKWSVNIVFLLSAAWIFSQQNSLLLNSYFKDQLFNNARNKSYHGSSFLPAFETEYDLNNIIRDSSKQYYELTEILFKRHLIEVKGPNYYLTISPAADLLIGKDREDTNIRKLFQNTRGIFIEGDLMKNFSFSTSIFENQGRFSNYESNYYSAVGELYPNQNSGKYTTQNAVIPGSARTKPFNVDGFDYAYATGNIIYRPHRAITLSAGNTSHFIGDGYRSLLLSDNSVPAPFFRGTFRISDKLQFNYLRVRLLNLLRRPVSTTVESYYESKAYSVNYLTFKPNTKFSVSLFEGVVWSRGDSIVSRPANPMFYNPVPLISGLILPDSVANSVIGIDLSVPFYKGHRVYAQFALGNLNAKKTALQMGYRGYNLFGTRDLLVQIEYNNVSSGMYQSGNERLNYSHYNLPMAHVKGNSFQEFVFRANYGWNRIYADLKMVYYLVSEHSPLALLPVAKPLPADTGKDGTIFHNSIEVGYRFNRKMNLTIFGNWQLRNYDLNPDRVKNNLLFFGLRTGINNHYNDF